MAATDERFVVKTHNGYVGRWDITGNLNDGMPAQLAACFPSRVFAAQAAADFNDAVILSGIGYDPTTFTPL